jgi:hypothetical protein
MLVRKRLGNTLALADKRGLGEREKRKRAKIAVAVLCRALDRLGR